MAQCELCADFGTEEVAAVDRTKYSFYLLIVKAQKGKYNAHTFRFMF